MSVDLERDLDSTDSELLQYRALSPAAVASLAAGLLSPLTLLSWLWLPLPFFGALLAALAYRQVRRRPDELTGVGLAKAGLCLSLLFMVVGPGWLTYDFLHEIPEGCQRISYAELQPDPAIPGEQIPKSALDLNGKRVFMKGYVYPGAKTEGIKTFLLVRDQGDCCFGGNPKITDRVQVTLAGPLQLTYRKRLHAVAGTFRVKPGAAVDGGGGVFYQLEADILR